MRLAELGLVLVESRSILNYYGYADSHVWSQKDKIIFMLAKLRSEGESRMQEQKKNQERKKALLVLVEKHLVSLGMYDTVTKLQAESSVSVDDYELADNIDLEIILQEYEQFYEMRFNKAPKLIRRAPAQTNTKAQLPRKQTNSTKLQKINPSTKNNNLKNAEDKPSTPLDLNIQGKQLDQPQEEKDSAQELNEKRLLKALPDDLLQIADLKELAMYLKRDIIQANPNVMFKDIVGLEGAKRLLREAVVIPLKYPQFFTGLLEPWKGVLLFGPPGTGKTLLAKAVATECQTTFFNISASSLVSKWRGDSEKLVRVLFELARHYQPSTIFIDEVDSIMTQRTSSNEHEGSRRMKTELLVQMDGLVKTQDRVFVLAASNLPWDLDVALLRRLEKRILINLPEKEARSALVQHFLPIHSTEKIEYDSIADKLVDYSGSDIKMLCKEAAMIPLRALIQKIEKADYEQEKKGKKVDLQVQPDKVCSTHLEEALSKVKNTQAIQLDKYKAWQHEFGST